MSFFLHFLFTEETDLSSLRWDESVSNPELDKNPRNKLHA
jgi:hypothetical protein